MLARPPSVAFDPMSSSLSFRNAAVSEEVTFGVAGAPKTVAPVPLGATAIAAYTFGPGPMGIQLEDVQGGTRVAISEVGEKSQAERTGVPVGGIIMKVNGRTATGKRRTDVGKWLAAAERPLLLHIMHPGGAIAAQASTIAADGRLRLARGGATPAQRLLHCRP